MLIGKEIEIEEIRICFSVGDILLHYEAAGQAIPTLKKRLWPDSPRVEVKQRAFNDHFRVLRLRAYRLNKEAT